MKTNRLFFILIIFAISCNNEKEPENIIRSDDTVSPPKNTDANADSMYTKIWTFQYDSVTKEEKPKQLRSIDQQLLTPKMVESIVNRNWPDVQIKYVKTSGDTVYVAIPNSTVLTQQLGTFGATEFMVSVTFTFTEIQGVRHVAFDFEPGDHAEPGVYDRTSWSLNL